MKHTYKLLILVALCAAWLPSRAQYPEFTCRQHNETPINIMTAEAIPAMTNPLNLTFMNTAVEAHYKGNIDFAPLADGNKLTYNGVEYKLLQMHAHTPSEHMINGNRYSYEWHFVFNNVADEGKTKLVIGVLGNFMPNSTAKDTSDVGNQLCAMLLTAATAQYLNGDVPPKETLKSVALNKLTEKGVVDNYYTYCGSLTTGHHDKVVTWVVCANPIMTTPDNAYLMELMKQKHMIEGNREIYPLDKNVPLYHVGK